MQDELSSKLKDSKSFKFHYSIEKACSFNALCDRYEY